MKSRLVFINRFFYPDYSATSQLLSDLCFALADQGWKVSVISSVHSYENAAPLPSYSSIRGVHVHRVRGSRFGRQHLLGRALDYLSFYFAAFFAVLRVVGKGDVVVVKTDPPLLSVALGPAISLKGAFRINWLQDLFPEIAEKLGVRMAGGASGHCLQRLRDQSCRTALHNVVLGQRMAEVLREHGVSDHRLTVIPNWGPAGLRPVAHADNPLRKSWGLGEAFVVGYSGNLGRAHDWQTLLGLVERLQNRADIQFLFVGGGAGMELLEQQVREKDLRNVQFQPYQPRDRLSASLSSIDLHLVSLESELAGYLIPSKIYGIAAVGRPAVFVGPADSEVADVLRECAFGVTVRNQDVAALVASVVKLAGDCEEYQRCCRAAREAYTGQFDFPRVLSAWNELLRPFARK